MVKAVRSQTTKSKPKTSTSASRGAAAKVAAVAARRKPASRAVRTTEEPKVATATTASRARTPATPRGSAPKSTATAAPSKSRAPASTKAKGDDTNAVHRLSGLAEFVAIDRMYNSLKAMRTERLAVLREAMIAQYREDAASAKEMGDLRKTIKVGEGRASAQSQLKAKKAPVLSKDEVAAMTKARIPLSLVPGRTVINPRYTSDTDASALAIIPNLARLVAENPQAGVPSDLFVTTESRSVPAADALLRALKLPADKGSDVLPVLCDVSISRGEIPTGEFLKLLKGAVAELTKAQEAAADTADRDGA